MQTYIDIRPRHRGGLTPLTQPKTPAHSECYWDLSDITVFLISIEILGAFIRIAVIFQLLSKVTLEQPTALLQAIVTFCILLALYGTIKLRHGGAVWRALGWTIPRARYLLAAPLAGLLMALLVTLVGQPQALPPSSIPTWKLAALAGVLAPILEESLFRGFLLPLMAQASGSLGAVILTAFFFAFFHRPPTVIQCVCIAMSGLFYGWARVVSGSTTVPAFMHAFYNLTLLACQRL